MRDTGAVTALLHRATAVAGAALLAALASATAVHAEEQRVTITWDGVTPRVLEVEPGDTVRFVNQDGSFAYRARSTGGAWSFDSGPTALLQGDFVVPDPLTEPGAYTYRVAQDEPFHGTVVLGDAAAAASTAGQPTAVPVPLPATPPGPAPTGSATPLAAAPVRGALAGVPTGRGLGLPTAVAAVLVVGAASLLLRLLLAEPVLSEGRGTV